MKKVRNKNNRMFDAQLLKYIQERENKFMINQNSFFSHYIETKLLGGDAEFRA